MATHNKRGSMAEKDGNVGQGRAWRGQTQQKDIHRRT